MVKLEKFWLFERSEFQKFLNFIIAQCMAEIRTKERGRNKFAILSVEAPAWQGAKV